MDSDIGSVLSVTKDYFKKYERFVRLNPRLAAEVEAIIRWSSYLIASRKSPVLGELLTSGASLLQLCNDIILRQANSELKQDFTSVVTQLKTFLTVIQSLELLAEIYARDTYGVAGKWIIITVIQITKAAIKLILLLAFNQGISRTQSIIPLDRIHYSEIVKLQEKFASLGSMSSNKQVSGKASSASTSNNSKSIVLKSSGRRMRSINESLQKGASFEEISNSTNSPSPLDKLQKQRLSILIERYKESRAATLTDHQLCGEILHVARPLVHLALMRALGIQSWTSYLTSLVMDVTSLYLVRSPVQNSAALAIPGQQAGIPECFQFNINEKMELGQRASSLLLYLLRSPFFDEYTKNRALEGLASTAESIPLLGGVLSTFIQYIPDWQKDYFRVWSE